MLQAEKRRASLSDLESRKEVVGPGVSQVGRFHLCASPVFQAERKEQLEQMWGCFIGLLAVWSLEV